MLQGEQEKSIKAFHLDNSGLRVEVLENTRARCEFNKQIRIIMHQLRETNEIFRKFRHMKNVVEVNWMFRNYERRKTDV